MDKETTIYIVRYFPNLMSDDDKAALKHNIFIEGYDNFERKVAKRIVQQNPSKVYFNRRERRMQGNAGIVDIHGAIE